MAQAGISRDPPGPDKQLQEADLPTFSTGEQGGAWSHSFTHKKPKKQKCITIVRIYYQHYKLGDVLNGCCVVKHNALLSWSVGVTFLNRSSCHNFFSQNS